MSAGTPHRPIRIDADLWAKAQAKAAQEGTKASAKVRELLTEWVEDRHAQELEELQETINALHDEVEDLGGRLSEELSW